MTQRFVDLLADALSDAGARRTGDSQFALSVKDEELSDVAPGCCGAGVRASMAHGLKTFKRVL